MKISEHIENTIERWRIKWGQALGSFLGAVISAGSLKLLEALEDEGKPYAQDYIDRFPIPPEVKGELENFLKQRSPIHLAAIAPMAIGVVIGSILGSFLGWAIPISNWTRYVGDKILKTFRFDAATIARIWLRDKPVYDKLFDDLRDMGWTEDRIAVVKELANVIPPLADMVRFADFGSFDPKIIELWREFYDAPGWIREPMALIGITDDWANKYWFSHWRQPGRFELGELHRRGLIDDELVKNAYLTQGYSSFWQNNLLELVKETWTRVDIRRMWDMRTITEEEMRQAYRAQGYYDKWLDGMVLWTKVYVAFPDLIARWKNGWISLDDVKAELKGYGMPADRIDEMIETKIKAAQPERTAKEKDLTKTEIYKGVKKGVITWAEGIELLLDLGYDEDEADYILTINVEALEGSPETYEEFKSITQKWRKAVGMEGKPMSKELIAAGAELVKLTKDIEALQAALKDEEATLIDVEELPQAATAKRDELRVALHRAESTLAAAQTNYNSLLAQWKHGR